MVHNERQREILRADERYVQYCQLCDAAKDVDMCADWQEYWKQRAALHNWKCYRRERNDDDLRKLQARFKPLVRVARQLYELVQTEKITLFGTAFMWNADTAERIGPVYGLEKVAEFATFHTYGYHGLVKPSIGEVLCQIPRAYVELGSAEFYYSVDVIDGELSAQIMEDHHAAITTLYKKGVVESAVLKHATMTEENKKRKDAEPEFVCMICMEAMPDTVVHPCLHCVVCHACSVRLRRTADARVCVACRRAISHVDE